MTFKDWHLAMYRVYPESGLKVDGFEARKAGWNAALEEAAKVIEEKTWPLSCPLGELVDDICSLKEE